MAADLAGPDLTARDLASGAAHARAKGLAQGLASGQVASAPREGALPLLADGFREWFTHAFARWLQGNFANPEHVSHAFGVRYQTALNWWQADNRASGDLVAVAFLSFPAAVGWFLAEWEAR